MVFKSIVLFKTFHLIQNQRRQTAGTIDTARLWLCLRRKFFSIQYETYQCIAEYSEATSNRITR